MPSELQWTIGVEVELLAPPQRSRADLAYALAERAGGRVRRFFHHQTEPSKVPGKPIFQNLTTGFEALDAEGDVIARCVDDLTLQGDLDRFAAPKRGWYRIVSDDARLLRLIARHADAERDLPESLEGVRVLFDTELEPCEGGMLRLVDELGAPIAIAAPLPGERERPCEIITPPITEDHHARLSHLIDVARELGFTIPQEAATHIHFDATPLRDARVLSNLICLLRTHGANIKRLLGTNPRCRRLGDWPEALFSLVNDPSFRSRSWVAAQRSLAELPLSKYCDFNIKNIVHPRSDKNTFEVRTLPVWLDATPIVEAAALFEAMLRHAIKAPSVPVRPPLPWNATLMRSFLRQLALTREAKAFWSRRIDEL